MRIYSVFIILSVHLLTSSHGSPSDSTTCWGGAGNLVTTWNFTGSGCMGSPCSRFDPAGPLCPPGSSQFVTHSFPAFTSSGLCEVCPVGYFVANLTQCQDGQNVPTCPTQSSQSSCAICPNGLTSYPYDSNLGAQSSSMCVANTSGVVSSSCACPPGTYVTIQSQNASAVSQFCSMSNFDNPFSCWLFQFTSLAVGYNPYDFYPVCEQCPPNTYQSTGGLDPCLPCPSGCTSNMDYTGCDCDTEPEASQAMCNVVGPLEAGCDNYNHHMNTQSNSIAFTFSESTRCS